MTVLKLSFKDMKELSGKKNPDLKKKKIIVGTECSNPNIVQKYTQQHVFLS